MFTCCFITIRCQLVLQPKYLVCDTNKLIFGALSVCLQLYFAREEVGYMLYRVRQIRRIGVGEVLESESSNNTGGGGGCIYTVSMDRGNASNPSPTGAQVRMSTIGCQSVSNERCRNSTWTHKD